MISYFYSQEYMSCCLDCLADDFRDLILLIPNQVFDFSQNSGIFNTRHGFLYEPLFSDK